MAKKPILTDDELDGGLPSGDATPPPLPGGAPGVTRPLGTASGRAEAATTRMVQDPDAETSPPPPPSAPEPQQQGRDASGHARPKTRIHGYGGEAARPEASEIDAPEAMNEPTVGWLVVTAGPGRGASIVLRPGMNGLGRGPENTAQVDFGDDTISRDAHAYVTYDTETRLFHLSHGGKANLVRLNDAPVLTAETLSHGDTIRIGATALRFVALCGPDFDWTDA